VEISSKVANPIMLLLRKRCVTMLWMFRDKGLKPIEKQASLVLPLLMKEFIST